jgi:hypothetical protein
MGWGWDREGIGDLEIRSLIVNVVVGKESTDTCPVSSVPVCCLVIKIVSPVHPLNWIGVVEGTNYGLKLPIGLWCQQV